MQVIIHYLLLANSIYVQQIYGATLLKKDVIAWKATVEATVEAAGLKGSGH